MITKFLAIKSLRPNTEWSMNGEDVENIIWHTPGVEPLTEEEVLAKIAELESLEQAEADARAAARESAISKLSALGLSEDEIRALVGA